MDIILSLLPALIVVGLLATRRVTLASAGLVAQLLYLTVKPPQIP